MSACYQYATPCLHLTLLFPTHVSHSAHPRRLARVKTNTSKAKQHSNIVGGWQRLEERHCASFFHLNKTSRALCKQGCLGGLTLWRPQTDASPSGKRNTRNDDTTVSIIMHYKNTYAIMRLNVLIAP